MSKPKTSPGPQPTAPDMSYVKETRDAGSSSSPKHSSPSPQHRNRHQSDPRYNDQDQRVMTKNADRQSRKQVQDKDGRSRRHHQQSDRCIYNFIFFCLKHNLSCIKVSMLRNVSPKAV